MNAVKSLTLNISELLQCENCEDFQMPLGFTLKLEGENPGLYWMDPDKDLPPFRICSPVLVIARTRDNDGKSWGRLLRWYDAEGRHHQWAMPASMTCGDGLELAKVLVDSGLEITPCSKARLRLATYIMESCGKGFARCTNKTGWHGDAFVLPDEVIAPVDAEKVFLSYSQIWCTENQAAFCF